MIDAIYWIKQTWENLNSSCNEKCFVKAGIKIANAELEMATDSEDDDLSLSLLLLKIRERFSSEELISVDELVTFENNEPISEFQTSYEIIRDIVRENNYNDSNVGKGDPEAKCSRRAIDTYYHSSKLRTRVELYENHKRFLSF